MEELKKIGDEAAAVITTPNKSPRPASLKHSSIGELFDQFSDLFLAGTKSLIVSPCGHKIYCFEHHFFHMAGIVVEGIPELTMPKERATILATREGFAHYELREKGSRARHLPSARATLESPDEVWEDNPKVESAKWVYIKEFDGKPYEFSVALVGVWEANSTIPVPFSSFPVERKNAKKWRQGKKIYP
jgi:hypothetical protein